MKKWNQLAAVFVLISATASGQENWSYKDGNSAPLKLERTFEKDGDLVGEFVDKNGAIVAISKSALAEPDAVRLDEFRKQENQRFPRIESSITKLRAGRQLTNAEITVCEAEMETYYDKLTKKNGTDDNTEFPKRDQCDCYIVMVKMALIHFDNHGGWPFRSDLRLMVADELKRRAGKTNDSFIHFCAIFPSLGRHDVIQAVASYKAIQKSDPFLANVAKKWTKECLSDSVVKSAFMESAGIE